MTLWKPLEDFEAILHVLSHNKLYRFRFLYVEIKKTTILGSMFLDFSWPITLVTIQKM